MSTLSVVHSKRKRRRYLLTGGIVRCGLCKAPLVGQQRRNHKGGPLIPYYMCHPAKNGCSKIRISGEPFERYVEAAFLKELVNPEFRAALTDGDAHAERREEILGELRRIEVEEAEYGRTAARRRIGPAMAAAAQAEFDAQRDSLSAEMAALPLTMPTIEPGDILADWHEPTLEEKRHFLSMFIEAIEVGPAERGKRVTEETMRHRVEITWRRRRE